MLFSCLAFHYAVSQEASKPATTKPAIAQADYSKEAFVDESDITRVSFENDGTGTREWLLRIRIQSDAGVQRYSVLTFPYQEATEKLDIDYVRVRKPDGTVVVTPADNVQDMPSDITRQAPFYSDLHEKHIAVKGLAVGDVLEAHGLWHVTKALAPGQFWISFNFSHDFIALHQELQVSLPRERAVKWKSPVKPVIAEDGTRRVFTWTSSQLEDKSADAQKKDQDDKLYLASRGQLPPPDVQLSSFQSWEEVGSWYNSLQKERVQPSPEIRAKALELTKGAVDENAKLRAIYSYVSTQFRYIGVAFGIGRYQPHSAADVLANQYGDCKDKHTLLASLLDAAGIRAYPALINSMHALDPDVPSPGQFDHVITAVPQQGSSYLWLDSTEEVAPFGYMLSVLRGKSALVIRGDKSAGLVTTAIEPPSPKLETFKISAKLDEDGTLQGKIDRSVSGDDSEVIFRAAFRTTPSTQWKDLVQQISYRSGFAGDVSDVTASPPEKTDEPFHWSYSYKRKDFPQWSERRINSPLPPMLSAAPDEKPDHPPFLGAIGELRYESRVELPKGYSPELPAGVDLKEDFAEYHSTRSASNGVLITERKLLVKTQEVPITEYTAYRLFAKAILEDWEAGVTLVASNSFPALSQYEDQIWQLPYSDNADAARAYDDAREAYKRKEGSEAEISDLKRALAIDPHFTRAWLWLGEIYKSTGQPDLALQAYREAIEVDPRPLVSYKALGLTLMSMKKYDEALSAWQDLLKVAPQNTDGLIGLASTLSSVNRNEEAATTMESAIAIAPERPDLQVSLGDYYLRAGHEEKALTAYKKALDLDPKPIWLNNIAYSLAQENRDLGLALEYAEKAVQQEEEISSKVSLAHLRQDAPGYTRSLVTYWDTLGWVHFRLGNYDKAEKYLDAAWMVTLGPDEAQHLGQTYEKMGNKKAAIRMYENSLAASRFPGSPETRALLEHLRRGGADPEKMRSTSSELSAMRTFKLPRIMKNTAIAEFFVLLGPGSTEVKFISGSDQLKSADKVIAATDFRTVFPDDGPSLLLRRGVLSCYSVSGCTFVLYEPNRVNSIK
jgi:tetratricopeptide (TPR) repeat protein